MILMEPMELDHPGYTEWDVLCGRGGRINRHTGNRLFRRLVEAKKPLFRTLVTKEERRTLFKSICQSMKINGVRFLRQEGDEWVEINEAEALSKTSQAFREPEKKRAYIEFDSAGVDYMLTQMSSKRRKGDLLDDDDDDVLPLQPFPARPRPLPFGMRARAKLPPPMMSGSWSTDCPPPTSLMEQRSREVSNFMQSVASSQPQPHMVLHESQDLLASLRQITMGRAPEPKTQLGSHFVKMVRDHAIHKDETISGEFGIDPAKFDGIFPTEQEHDDFVGLWKEISGNLHQTSEVLEDWEELPLQNSGELPKQQTIEMLQMMMMRTFPDNCTNRAVI